MVSNGTALQQRLKPKPISAQRESDPNESMSRLRYHIGDASTFSARRSVGCLTSGLLVDTAISPIYEPSLNVPWRTLIASRDKVSVITTKVNNAFKEDDDLLQFGRSFHAAMMESTKSMTVFADAAATRGRRIAEEKGQAENSLRLLRTYPSDNNHWATVE